MQPMWSALKGIAGNTDHSPSSEVSTQAQPAHQVRSFCNQDPATILIVALILHCLHHYLEFAGLGLEQEGRVKGLLSQ